MTLVLAAANSEQIVMLTDRRLTSAGTVVEEEAGKLCIFVLGGARFAVGFTGLARAQGFDMRQWLLQALWDSAEPNLIQSLATLTRFRERASRDFAQLSALRALKPQEKRTEFVFVGYLRDRSQSVLVTALVSNCRDTAQQRATTTCWDEFALSAGRENVPRTEEPVLIAWAGAAAAVKERDVDALRPLLLERKPHQAVLGKAIEIMIDAADRPQAGGTVGKRIVWVRIPSDFLSPSEMGYYAAEPTFDVYTPDIVTRTPSGSGSHAFFSVKREDRSTPPSIVPKVHRHAPCPCKSGRRYAQCHGRRSRRRRQPTGP